MVADTEQVNLLVRDAVAHGVSEHTARAVLTGSGFSRVLKDGQVPVSESMKTVAWSVQLDESPWKRPYLVAPDVPWDERVAALRVLIIAEEMKRGSTRSRFLAGMYEALAHAWESGTMPSLILDACASALEGGKTLKPAVSDEESNRTIRLLNCVTRITKICKEGIAIEKVHLGMANVIGLYKKDWDLGMRR